MRVRVCARVNNSNSYCRLCIRLLLSSSSFFGSFFCRSAFSGQYSPFYRLSSFTFLCGDALLSLTTPVRLFHFGWVHFFLLFALLFRRLQLSLCAHIQQFISLWPGVIFVVIGIVYLPIPRFQIRVVSLTLFRCVLLVAAAVAAAYFPKWKWSCSRHKCRIPNRRRIGCFCAVCVCLMRLVRFFSCTCTPNKLCLDK